MTDTLDEDLRFFRIEVGQAADFAKPGAAEKPWRGSSTHVDKCVECGTTTFMHSKSGCLRCGGTLVPNSGVDEMHPTVKPVALMRHLCRLVCPAGGMVLDPFGGTGTTGEAAMLEGMDCVLIEREGTYIPLIKVRIHPDHLTECPTNT